MVGFVLFVLYYFVEIENLDVVIVVVEWLMVLMGLVLMLDVV